MCGGALSALQDRSAASGPSPRVRGSLRVRPLRTLRHGTIPACAGEPRHFLRLGAIMGDHPRVCGGASSRGAARPRARGPSPRVRGSHRRNGQRLREIGTIPACAGEPSQSSPSALATWDHPRVCGGAREEKPENADKWGPSPRVRGSRKRVAQLLGGVGTIPACAGEPNAGYNRASWLLGPSPRVRGSRLPVNAPDLFFGTIPACAGEPFPVYGSASGAWDHPRVCGGAPARTKAEVSGLGPSPRVRGSPRKNERDASELGTIPACAGEPRTRSGG